MEYPLTFDTDRLHIRPLTTGDAADWLPFTSDGEALRFFPAMAQGDATANANTWIERQLTRYREHRYGLEALVNKETGEFIGQCGLLLQEIDQRTELEVGYSLLPGHWGKGYATEAASAFRDHAFTNDLCQTLISIIHCENIPSQRVAERSGMQREKRVTWSNQDVFIYRIDRSAWKSITGH